jgi:hypothetical protein
VGAKNPISSRFSAQAVLQTRLSHLVKRSSPIEVRPHFVPIMWQVEALGNFGKLEGGNEDYHFPTRA